MLIEISLEFSLSYFWYNAGSAIADTIVILLNKCDLGLSYNGINLLNYSRGHYALDLHSKQIKTQGQSNEIHKLLGWLT